MIGPIVTVTVDRPLGSYHPEHPNLYYPINYGYIKGTVAADTEKILTISNKCTIIAEDPKFREEYV